MKIKSKSGLRVFTIEDIRSWGPCYDPSRYLAEGWRGTAIDILDDTRISAQDRFWVVLRNDIISDQVNAPITHAAKEALFKIRRGEKC